MSIDFVATRGSCRVSDLDVKETFIYQKNVYMRVATKSLGKGNFDTRDKLVVVKLSTGYLSHFSKSTWVTPCEIEATIKEMEG